MILKDTAFKKKAVFLSTQAKDEAPHYEHTSIGYNYRMSSICAGIGRGQMEVLEDRVATRRANRACYKDLFKDAPDFQIHTEPSDEFFSNQWLSIVQINPKGGLNAEQVRLKIQEENIETCPIFKPMNLQPVFRDALYFGDDFAEECFERGLCLPLGLESLRLGG